MNLTIIYTKSILPLAKENGVGIIVALIKVCKI
jgi:hypothetical protein